MEEKIDEFKGRKGLYEIPKESFVSDIQKYFNISAEILQTENGFHTESQTYRFEQRNTYMILLQHIYSISGSCCPYIENS